MKGMKMLSKLKLSVGALLIGLAACSAPQQPTTVQLAMAAAADMNAGAPTQAKVYYLTSTARFQAADFFAVFGAPEATLGDDLIAVDTYQLTPGGSVTDTKSLPTPAVAIGVVAAFRDINGRFLAIKPLAPNSVNTVRVSLTGNTVTVR